MLKKLPIFLFLASFIFHLSKTGVFAQDPYTIKFKSFTPAPTRTPTITPVRTPTGLPTVNTQPTIPGSNPACFLSNRGFASDCAVVSRQLQLPKPRYLKDTSLCTDANMYPYFKPTFVPPDLVNLKQSIGNQFWVWRDDSMYNKCKIDDLRRMLAVVEKTYNNCVAFVAHGYRSYAEQEGLWNTYQSCLASNNPINRCYQAAPPGRSLHQGGIGIDLYCMELNPVTRTWDMNNIPDSFTSRVPQFNFHRPLPGSDPPHFNGL